MTIDELNTLTEGQFVAALGAIYEHAPWVAEGAFHARPFPEVAAVHAAMARVVADAGEPRQRALVAGHPDLAGTLARAGELAPFSAHEQGRLGLDRLSDAEFAQFDALNTAYRARFGFPFVIAVKRQTRASVLAAFARRVANDPARELRTALSEIDAIAGFRLAALLAA